MESPKFLMSNSPLALVVGQIGFSYAPELNNAGEVLREPFKKLGLPIAESNPHMHIENRSPSAVPNIRHETTWLFIDPQKTMGVSIGPKHLTLTVNAYKDFQAYSNWVGDIVEAIQKQFAQLYFQTIGLRYFNVYKPPLETNEWLVERVQGISHANIETSHFHHRYEFWCATRLGALHARCAREHGGSAPKSLEFAAKLFPQRFLYNRNDHVYHLDIFENSRPLDPQQLLSPSNVRTIFNEQHSRIDKIFLNFISNEGLRVFGWKTKD